MVQLEIWFDRSMGTPFELELSRLPTTYEFERRDAMTYRRRTATPWLIYTFRFPSEIAEEIVGIAEGARDRYKKPIRVYRLHFNTDAAVTTSD